MKMEDERIYYKRNRKNLQKKCNFSYLSLDILYVKNLLYWVYQKIASIAAG